MSVATFIDTMVDIIIHLGDREIYNDIRSLTSDTAGFETAYSTKEVQQDVCQFSPDIAPNAEEYITVYVESGDTEITWLGITHVSAVGETIVNISESECLALADDARWRDVFGGMCMFGDRTEYLQVEAHSETSSSFTFKITNTHPTLILRYTVKVAYRYLAERRVLVRRTNESSIKKYGRRVMNLVWELGQTIEQQESTCQTYLDRYEEPVPMATVRIQGSNDTLAAQVFARDISECITLENTILGLSGDFFINKIDFVHDCLDTPEVEWQCEQVRTMEENNLFLIGTSLLDGPHILGS